MHRSYDFRPTRGGGPRYFGWLLPLVLLLLLLIGSIVRSYGQATIARAEYFVDTDPGFGAATAFALPATPAADLPGLSASVPLGSLSVGFHALGVRSQDANGAWSLTSRRTFYYEPLANGTLANVTKAEYFIDTDPGFAAATDVPVTAATDISGVAFGVSLGSLSAGFHQLGVRSRDANGQWSLTNRRTFYYEPLANSTLPNVTKVEYFIDTDPGFGMAVDVPVTAATDISGVVFNVNISSLTAGFHQLGVRSQDANGKWSLTNRRTFYYEPAALNTLPNVTKVEYFIDAEPGFGSGTDVPVTAATDLSGVAFGVNLSSLSTGFHTLSLRSRDANGKWSLTSVRSFYYEPVLAAAPNVNKIEYYFDADPGFGAGTNVPVPTPAPDLANFSFAADASGLADGAHRIFFRSRDANGKWSLVSNRSFLKNGCASSANFAAGLPSTNYTQGGSYIGTAENAFNSAPSGTNNFLAYNGAVIQADLGSTASQTISEVRLTVAPQTTTNFTLQIQTSANLTTWTTVDSYAATLTGAQTYSVARTLATPATGVRGIRLVFGTSTNVLSITGVGAYYFNCVGPTITSFTPAGGGPGTSVVLTGTNLTGATAVTFNGTAAPGFVVNSGTQITVSAPAGGTSGQICVTTPGGTACSAASYVYPPTIATGTVSSSAFCASTLIQVPFTTSMASYGSGNVFNFQLSDASGNFTAGSRLYGSLISTNANGGVLRDSVAFRTPAGSGYRVRVVASNPNIIGTDNGTNLTIYPTPVAAATSNSPVVFNGTIQLAAQPTGQSSYQWYVAYTSGGTAYVGAGQALNLTNAQPTQSGKYYVYVQNANGCQDSASVRVLVQPNAVPVLTMGQFGFNGCAGATFNIGFVVSGNNFASGNTISAQLSDASGSFAAPTVIGSAAFTGQGGGSVAALIPTNTLTGSGYRIRLVGSSPAVTSTTDNGSNITITTQPTATPSSNSPVAYNGTIQLTAQTVAGASYQWFGPGFSSNQQNPTIANATPSNSGTYTLYVTVNGCQSPGTATTVVVNPSAQPILAISQFNGSLCPGTGLNIGFSVTGNVFGAGNVITAQLSDASGSFAAPVVIGSVAFTGQGGGTVSTIVPQNTPAGTGYRIRLIASNPATVSPADNGTNLTVPTTLVATASSNSPIASGGTLQLNAGPNGAATYQWFVQYTGGGTSFISNQQNPTFNNVTTASSGFYYVYVTQGGCTDSASVRVLVNPPVSTTLALGTFSGQFCAGNNYAVNYTVGGAGLSNGTITAQLSDASGGFGAPVALASVSFNGTGSGSLGFTLPATTADGAGYRIRLVSTNPALTSNDNGTNLTISNLTNVVAGSNSPVAAGATITFSSSGVPAGAIIGWTGPNGFSSSQPNPSLANANAANAGTYSFTASINGCSVTRPVQVTVGAPVLAISTGAVSGSLCPGSAISVPYNVTTGSVNGGNTFTVQLSNASGSFASPVLIGSLASNASSGTVAAVIPTSTPAGSGYRVRVVADNPAAVGSDNGSNLTIGALTYAWTGGVSTDWFNGANWSCGQVPTATSVVTIPGGASFYPVITGSTAALALNLTIASGATFTNNGIFNLYGNVTVNGTVLASSTSSWYFAGGITQFIYGANPLQVGNLYISNGSTLTMNNVLNVYANWYNFGTFVGGPLYNVYFNGTGGTQIIGGTSVTTFYNAYVNSGAVVNLGLNAVFLNNFVVNGTFSAVTYGVIFGGSVAQTIGGTGSSSYYTVTINNTVGVMLVSNITVLGDWINNGLFSGGTYSVIFAGTVAQIIGGTQVTNFYNVTFNNLISVTLHQNIYVLGGFVNTGVFYGWYLSGGSTLGYFVRFGGTAAQVITANVTTYFYHFYADNAAGVSLATNIYIAGNYYLYSGTFNPGTYTVYFNGNEGPGVVQTVGGYTALNFYGWNVVSGAYVRLIQNVTLLGGFANLGTFYGYNLVGGVYTGYTFTFGGSGAQSLTGGGVYEFWHVTWNNLAGITLNQNISVWGNWLNNGGYLANGYLVNFIGNVAQTIGGSVLTTFHHVTITNTVSVSLLQAVTVLGNWAGTGVFLGNGYLVYFNGTAAQTILAGLNTRFFDLRFNNPTTVTLLSNIYLNGSWTHDGGFVANGFRVFFSGSALQIIGGTVTSLFHHLTISPNASVQLARVVTLLGDWTNDGSFAAGTYTVTFGGTVAQLIGGTQVTNFYGLTMSNPVSVTLAQHIYVLGGFLNTGVFYGYQVLGGVTTGYFVRFGGTVAQVVNANATTYFYHFYADNAAGVSLLANVYIAGNYYLYSGSFNPGTYTVFFNGTVSGYVQTVGGYTGLSFYGWNIGSAASVRLLQNVTLLGNFANAGTFYGYNLVGGVYTGYTFAFAGTVAQSLTGAGVYDFWHLTWNNLAGVTLNRDISLRGNWLHLGGFVANGYLVTFGGSVLQLIGGSVATVFHHFTIATGATVRQDVGITLLGDWTNNGSFLPNSLLVYFNGTALQTIAGTALTTFYDVTFNNAVNVSLGQNIDVTRNFVNQGGYCGCGFRTRFNGTVAQSITCTSGRTHFHDITFANTAGVTLLDGIYVSGLWVNNGGYLANSQTVIFDGTALQTIGGTVLSAFYNVGITNAVDVQLLRDITVAGFWNNTGLFHGQGFGVSFNGTALQTITTTGATARSYFHHITWANLVGCVLAGDIYVAGNWLCNGPFNPATYTVYFNGTVAQTCGGTQQIRFFGLSCANPAGITYNGPVYLLGNFVNTGLVNCGAFGWYCIGTGPQTIGGISTTPTRFYDLFIQNGSGVTATDNWFLTHVLTLTTGNLASNGHLTLTSNASGTAMVVNPVGGGVVTGVSTMERFITGLSGAPGYRHYSSPMKLSAAGISTTVQEFADDLPVFELNPAYNTAGNTATPFPTFFQYDETRLTASKPGFDDGWMVPTATQDLLPLRGYTAQTLPTTTVDISGLLQTGNVSYSLGRGSLANSGWHLLGNPYPAPMDWDVARSTTGMLSGVADALYVFEPSGQYTGTYKAYVNGLGQNGGTKDLAAMQGFFVRATAPTASVSLTNAVRATSYLSPVFNRTTTAPPVLRLEARNLATATADETVVYFEPGAALGFSAQHDAYKVQLNGNGRPSLWSQAGAESFAINGLPDLATAPVIPLGVRVSQDGAHELTLTGLTDAPAGTQVWLEDRVLNRRQNLAASPAYAFTMLANYSGQRFYLNFVAGTVTAVTTGQLAARTALYPNPTTARATLELAGLREQGPVQVEVVNVLGQTVRQLSTRPKQGFLSETIDLNGLATGVYTVRIHAQEGTVVKRLVKE
ncbi:T9SS type A sorting domain-containing protein [Hymenobacter sp. M29]|uniref:T9SS type A sorting domain-containing protein n=1 Tax=Hymenobacter mellowenesis TaxID=3063995 RepID=A0ABT9A9N1_9BACT|nr:T9SS type A sorting domain-containing protein [Hymenobacter sp. M29]MDO7846549.1 T9SS type A sorting domain-containing protein [Hymenobacter sp. M29]